MSSSWLRRFTRPPTGIRSISSEHRAQTHENTGVASGARADRCMRWHGVGHGGFHSIRRRVPLQQIDALHRDHSRLSEPLKRALPNRLDANFLVASRTGSITISAHNIAEKIGGGGLLLSFWQPLHARSWPFKAIGLRTPQPQDPSTNRSELPPYTQKCLPISRQHGSKDHPHQERHE